MNSPVKALDVSIMGREFRVACPEEDEPALLESAEFLDKRMREIRDTGKVTSVERIAIMAALNITHEFLSTRLGGSFDVGEFRRKIKSLESQLDQALSDQDDLF
jgi:cell division protein ZapA